MQYARSISWSLSSIKKMHSQRSLFLNIETTDILLCLKWRYLFILLFVQLTHTRFWLPCVYSNWLFNRFFFCFQIFYSWFLSMFFQAKFRIIVLLLKTTAFRTDNNTSFASMVKGYIHLGCAFSWLLLKLY